MHIETKTSEAIEFAGNKSKLASLLEITRQSLTSWGPYLPQTSAQKLFILTKGEIGKQVNEDSKRTSSSVTQQTNHNPMFYP